jgi:chaperone required for assembly of F1-ATPase
MSKDKVYFNDLVKKLTSYLESDQILFLQKNILEYIDRTENIRTDLIVQNVERFMLENFDIDLEISSRGTNTASYNPYSSFNTWSEEDKTRNLNILKAYLSSFQPWALCLLEQLTGITKSMSISLALLNDILTPLQAHLISNSEEHYQQKFYGEVEGHHDIDHEMIMAKFYSVTCFNKLMQFNSI